MPFIEFGPEYANRASWTGYYTTNPFAKKNIASFGLMYRHLRQLSAVGMLANNLEAIDATDSAEFEWVAAANQHHDTITGTSLEEVAYHYLCRNYAWIRKAGLKWRWVA